MNINQNIKRAFSGVLSFTMAVTVISMSCIQSITAYGVEDESNKNALFSFATEEAIKINTASLSLNGDISTDGVCVIDANNYNIHGSINENLNETIMYYHNAIEKKYFWDDNAIYYSYNSDNDTINEIFNVPTVMEKSFTSNENITINDTAIMSASDFVANGNSFNMNRGVLYSATGNITIDTNNFTSDGLIYAPLGTVTINSNNVNIMGQVIAQKIEINGEYSVNINYDGSITNLFDEFESTINHPNEDYEDIIDIGEVYWKDPNPVDYLWNDYVGGYAVKNQFLLSCDAEIEFGEIESLVEELDAEIVGYIELTNDYQIEFNKDISFDEINDIIGVLSGISNVRMISFNIANENSDEFCTDDAQWSSSWQEDSPDGNDWGVESIKLCSALAEIGVIPDTSASYNDINTSNLFNVKIGLIDGAFDEWHEDLNFVNGGVWNNFISESELVNSITDEKKYNHGTHVAGTMGAVSGNGLGITGVALKSRLYGFACDVDKVSATDIDTTSKYDNIYHSFGIKAALSLLIGNNIKVINHSRGNGDMAFYAAQGNERAMKYQEESAAQISDLLSKLIDKGYNFIICTSAGNSNATEYYEDPDAEYGYIKVSVYNKDHKENPEAYPNADTTKKCSGLVEGYTTDSRYDDSFQFIDNPKIRLRIISVGAMDQSRSVTDFCCRGDRIDVMAPGTDIYSCTNTALNTTNAYEYKNGTSMATPHVTGSIGLAFSVNTSLDASLMKFLLSMSCDSSSDYPILNTYELMKLVNIALDTYEENKTNINHDAYNGIATGLVTGEDGAGLKGVTISVSPIITTDATDPEPIDNEKTDKDGRYEIVLSPGNYVLLVSKDGYISETIYCELEAETTKFIDKITLYEEGKYGKEKYTINGTINNALTGSSLSDVDILFRKGWNNTSSQPIADAFATTTTSDNLGKFTVKMKVGAYTAVLKKDGFITVCVNMVVTPNSTEQYASMTPILDENVYRIVLSWGDIPNDLDSYLIGTVSDKSFYVYYDNKTYQLGDSSVVLDVDDTTKYGPETITINWTNDFGKCSYIVKDFTNRSYVSSNILSYSGAKVVVYKGNEQIANFAVPAGKTGVQWHVFDMVNGEIVPVNTIN